MRDKGFADTQTVIETPNDAGLTEKPFKSSETTFKRVDINVLKSKLKDSQKKESKKSIIILVLFFTAVSSLGIYLSV